MTLERHGADAGKDAALPHPKNLIIVNLLEQDAALTDLLRLPGVILKTTHQLSATRFIAYEWVAPDSDTALAQVEILWAADIPARIVSTWGENTGLLGDLVRYSDGITR